LIVLLTRQLFNHATCFDPQTCCTGPRKFVNLLTYQLSPYLSAHLLAFASPQKRKKPIGIAICLNRQKRSITPGFTGILFPNPLLFPVQRAAAGIRLFASAIYILS